MYVEKGPRPVADLCQPAPPHTTHNGCPADSTRPQLPSQVVQSGPGPPWTARGYITSAIIYPGPLMPSFSTVSPVSFQAAQAMSAHVASTTQWVQSCSSCCCGCSCCSHCFPVEICCRSPCSTVDLMFSHMTDCLLLHIRPRTVGRFHVGIGPPPKAKVGWTVASLVNVTHTQLLLVRSLACCWRLMTQSYFVCSSLQSPSNPWLTGVLQTLPAEETAQEAVSRAMLLSC